MTAKNKTSVPVSSIYRIKPWVLFRLTNQPMTGPDGKYSVQVKNIRNGSLYEFKGRAAILWLNFDGTKTTGQAIEKTKRLAQIQDRRFPSLSRKLIETLVAENLIFETMTRKRDARAADMQKFIYLIQRPVKAPQRFRVKSKSSRKHQIATKDRSIIREAYAEFDGLASSGIKVKVERYKIPNDDGKFHIFLAGIKKSELVNGFGSSLNAKTAVKASIGEALERYFSFETKPDVEKKSYLELLDEGSRALDPDSFTLFDPGQPVVKEAEVVNLAREKKINWTYFEDALHNDKKILVPSRFNGENYEKSQFFCECTTSGCAAGKTPHETRLKATLELAERDALLFYWRSKNIPTLVDWSSTSDRLWELKKFIGPRWRKIKLFHLKTDLPCVVVQATFWGDKKKGEPIFLSACGSSMDAVGAVEKSLKELLFVLAGSRVKSQLPLIQYGLNFDNSIWDFSDRSSLYAWNNNPKAYDFLMSNRRPIISLSQLMNQFDQFESNPEDQWKFLVNRMKRCNVRLFYRQNAPIEVQRAGLYVGRAFSPDLLMVEGLHRYRSLGQRRHYILSKVLGLPRQPKSFQDLNDWPQPLS